VGTDHVHRVCTYEEAEKAIRAHDEIFLNDCFCRTPAKEGKTPWEYCGHPVETCMGFHRPNGEDPQYEYQVIGRERALEMFEGWKEQGRLFRFMEDEEWICFCCACGCQWFRDKEGNLRQDPSDKSPYIEETDLDLCNLCGDCVDVCAYDARSIEDDAMVVVAEQCYGCSACEHACPEDAIDMRPR